MQKKKSLFTIETLTFTALLVALQVILGNVLQIPLMEKQYNFGFLPIAAAGALLGAPYAAIVGALGDFLGAHLFPQGAYFPGFTLTNVLVGLCCGLMLYRRKPALWRVAVTVVISLVCINWPLNSFWLSMLYASRGFIGWLAVRGPNYLIEVPANILMVFLTLQALSRVRLPAWLALKK